MSISSQLIQRVEDAVYHSPNMIPILFKEGKVKAGFLHSRLRRYVPHRVGIEFECFGDFANQYLMDNKKKWDNCEYFERYFKILDFSQDSLLINHKVEKIKSKELLKESREEIRVSIRDYRQLVGLYNILKEMAKYCTISEDCGIHIHIDLTNYDTNNQKEKAVKWFNKHLDEVESIFPKYTGSYNKRIAQQGKSSWINLSSKGTVEFRIAPLTFDYEVLIVWIVKCSKLVSRMISECHLGVVKSDNEFQFSEVQTINGIQLSNDPSLTNVPAANTVDLVNAQELLLYAYLDQNHITHQLDDGTLYLNQRGRSLSINYTVALELFRAGGIIEVLRGAHPMYSDVPIEDNGTSVCVTDNSNNYNVYTTLRSGSWSGTTISYHNGVWFDYIH